MRCAIAVLVAGALLAAGCGDDGDEDARGPAARYAEAMAARIASVEEMPVSEADASCLSAEFVDALGGAERLEEAGIQPSDLRGPADLSELGLELGPDEAEGIAGAYGACDLSLADLVLGEAGESLPEEARSCVEENLDEDILAELFERVLAGASPADEAPEELLEPVLRCL